MKLNQNDLDDDISIIQLLIKAKLCSSGKEARRLISEGGAKLNDKTIKHTNLKISDLASLQEIKLSAGKKRHALILHSLSQQ